MEEGAVLEEEVVEGGTAAAEAAMEWRGCLGAGERCPFGDSSRGLRGTARTGEYRVGGGTERCRLAVVVVVTLLVVAVETGRGLRGGNKEVCGRDSGGGGAEEEGGLSRSEGGMVSAPGGGGLSVRLCNIWALSSTWSCPGPLRPFPRSRVCWDNLGRTGAAL